ncbi:hypothetical protein [Desulfonatronum sp. SC1]|nr:hypothetical protein [Desulfonatronum sp. SC1]
MEMALRAYQIDGLEELLRPMEAELNLALDAVKRLSELPGDPASD